MDSYGDGELKQISQNVRYELGEDTELLTKLIQTIPKDYKFEYNKIQFQQYGNGINTCGKWNTVCVSWNTSKRIPKTNETIKANRK